MWATSLSFWPCKCKQWFTESHYSQSLSLHFGGQGRRKHVLSAAQYNESHQHIIIFTFKKIMCLYKLYLEPVVLLFFWMNQTKVLQGFINIGFDPLGTLKCHCVLIKWLAAGYFCGLCAITTWRAQTGATDLHSPDVVFHSHYITLYIRINNKLCM